MKIKIFKIKPKFKKGGLHANPNVGWGLVLLASLGLIISALAFGALLFLRTQAESAPEEAGAAVSIRIVKKARIEKVLGYFREREQRSRELLIAPPDVVDPSL